MRPSKQLITLLSQERSGAAVTMSLVLLLMVGIPLLLAEELVQFGFGRVDIFIVTLFSSVPLVGIIYQQRIRNRFAMIAGIIGTSSAVIISISLTGMETNADSNWKFSRLWTSIAVITAITSAAAVLVPHQHPKLEKRNGTFIQLGSALLAALLIPLAYADSVSRSCEERLRDALSGQQFKLSQSLTQTLSAISTSAKFSGIPIQELNDQLTEALAALHVKLSQPLPATPPISAVGQRVVQLMQCERNDEALTLLQTLAQHPNPPPQVFDYSGLCYQRLKEWDESLKWYERARQYWEHQPSSPDRSQALLSALKGIAFANRQQDRLKEAEQAYLSAISIAPSGELHFLLARLYEQQERTIFAKEHARKATVLDPQQFTEEYDSLLRRMSLTHFGCLQLLND